MISLIIPTMWRYPPFIEYLNYLVEIECIDDIVIINNDVARTPENEILKHYKLNIYNSKENLYVNPSWNLGSKLAKNSLLGFLSDDVEVDLNVFDKVDKFMNSSIGMIGILARYADHEQHYDKFFTDGSIEIVSTLEPDDNKRPPPIGIGNLFFVRKDDWKDIPNEIKIFHGEALQWNRLSEIKNNYIITNCKINTPWHVTWKHLSEEDNFVFDNIQRKDQKLAQEMKFIFR